MGGARFSEADIVAQGKFLVTQLKVLEEVKAAPLCPFLTVLDKKWMSRERGIGRKQVRSLLQPSKKELEQAARLARAQEKGGAAPAPPPLVGAVEAGAGGEAPQSARKTSASQAPGRKASGGRSGDRGARRRGKGGTSNQDRGKVHGLAGGTFRTEVKALYSDPPFVPAAKEKYRPQPSYEFIAAPELVPRLLSLWDLLSSYRELLRVPPIPFERFQRAFVNDREEKVPIDRAAFAGGAASAKVAVEDKPRNSQGTGFTCPVCTKDFKNATGLGVHCFKTGHDRYADERKSMKAASEASKNKHTLPVIPESRFMTGPAGQGALIQDVHTALLRAIEGADMELYTAPKFAKLGAAAHVTSRGVYLPLVGVSWPAIVLQCLEDHAETVSYDDKTRVVMESLREVDYADLVPSQRLTLLEALAQVFCSSEAYIEHVTQRLPPNHVHAAYQTPVLPPVIDRKVAESTSRVTDITVLGPVPRGCPLGEDAKGRRYFQLGDEDSIFVEEASGMNSMTGKATWGSYSASQIPELMGWLRSGNQYEKDLAANIAAGLPQSPAPEAGPAKAVAGDIRNYMASPDTAAASTDPHTPVEKPGNPAAEGSNGADAEAPEPSPEEPNIGDYSLNACIDGYCHLAEYVNPLEILKREIESMARHFRFWECKNTHAGMLKLATRASILQQLSELRSSSQLPRLLADLESLLREELVRKNRRWSEDHLPWLEANSKVRTLAQASVSAATMLFPLTRRKPAETMTAENFFNLRRKMRCGQMFVPAAGDKVVLCWSGYYAHLQRYKPSGLSAAKAHGLPAGVSEKCVVRDIAFFGERTGSHRDLGDSLPTAWVAVQRSGQPKDQSFLSLALYIDESPKRPSTFLAPAAEFDKSMQISYHTGQRFKKYYSTSDGRRTGGFFRGTILNDYDPQAEPGRDPWNALEIHWDDKPVFCSKTKVVGGSSSTKVKPPEPKPIAIDYKVLAEAAAEREALLASTKRAGEELLRLEELKEAGGDPGGEAEASKGGPGLSGLPDEPTDMEGLQKTPAEDGQATCIPSPTPALTPEEPEQAAEPAKVEPAVVEPAEAEPAAAEPVKAELTAVGPGEAGPAAVEPAEAEVAAAAPAEAEPAAAEPAKAEPAAMEPAEAEPAAVKPAEIGRVDLMSNLRKRKRTINTSSLYNGCETRMCPWDLTVVAPGEENDDLNGRKENPVFSPPTNGTARSPPAPKPKLPKEEIKPIRAEIGDDGELVIKKAPGRRRNSLNYERLTQVLQRRYSEMCAEGDAMGRVERLLSIQGVLEELVRTEEEAYWKEKRETLANEKLVKAAEKQLDTMAKGAAVSPSAGEKRKERDVEGGTEGGDADLSPPTARIRPTPPPSM